MSDKELVDLYKSTGTGTGSGDTVRATLSVSGEGALTPIPANETQVVESAQTLRSLGIALFFTLILATGQFVEAAAPGLAAIIFAHVPQIPFLNQQVLSALVLGFAGWLQKRAASKHKVAVVKALVTDPTEELKAAYEAQKKITH